MATINKKTKKYIRKNFLFDEADVTTWEEAAIKENRSLTNFIVTTLNKAVAPQTPKLKK